MFKTILILIFPLILYAQGFNFVFEPDSIPLEIEGWQPYCPWAGGTSESNPAIVDIDGDGVLDFFVGEFPGNLKYFHNDGDMNIAQYNFITSYYDSIYVEESRNNPCFRDIDNDGDLDIIIGDIDSNVHLYRNIGTLQSPVYIHESSNIVPQGPPWCCAPELIDIDDDGDYDLYGGFENITFYRNIGTPDSFSFQLESGIFSGINVQGWASPDFVDLDSDHDYDLFIGCEGGSIWYYRNDGDSVNYNFTYVTNYYESIDVGSYSSPEFADIDGDGDYDLFVGKDGGAGDLYFYENIGTVEIPDFQYITHQYLTMDLGSLCLPQLVDIDGDSLADLLIGEGSGLTYLANVGTAEVPVFQFVTDNFQNISSAYDYPCFVDIDGDGDYDLLAGESVIPGPPDIALYINQGTAQEPDLVLQNTHYISNPEFFVNVYPGMADIDADGDFDLFVTSTNGNFYFYQNNGTAQSAIFTYITNQWQGIHFSYPSDNWRGFCFFDLDEDGDLDLLISEVVSAGGNANIGLYRNVGTAQNAVMHFEGDLIAGFSVGIWDMDLYDIDADGDLDLFAGEGNGGVMFFRNWGDSTWAAPPPFSGISPSTFSLQPCYPNPFNHTTIIPLELPERSKVKIQLYNIQGRLVGGVYEGIENAGWPKIKYHAGNLASGVYFCRVAADGLERGGKYDAVNKLLLLK